MICVSNGIKNIDERNIYFEEYLKSSQLELLDSPFFKNYKPFNPYEYIFCNKTKSLPIVFTTITSLCFYEIQELLNHCKKPVQCPLCKKYSVLSKSNQIFCNRIYKDGKTCLEFANTKKYKNQQYNEKVKDDEYLNAYMRAYRKIYKNKYKNPDNKLSEEDTKKLKEIKKLFLLMQNNKISELDYLDKLKYINKKIN